MVQREVDRAGTAVTSKAEAVISRGKQPNRPEAARSGVHVVQRCLWLVVITFTRKCTRGIQEASNSTFGQRIGLICSLVTERPCGDRHQRAGRQGCSEETYCKWT